MSDAGEGGALMETPLPEAPRGSATRPSLEESSPETIGAAFDTGCDGRTGGHSAPPCAACEGIRRRVTDLVVSLRDVDRRQRQTRAEQALRSRVETATEWARTRKALDALTAAFGRVREQVRLPLDAAGALLHEGWADSMRSRGYHHPTACDGSGAGRLLAGEPCSLCHAHLVAWTALPDAERAAYRAAADRLLSAVAATVEVPPEARIDTSTTALDAVLAELRKPKDEKARA